MRCMYLCIHLGYFIYTNMHACMLKLAHGYPFIVPQRHVGLYMRTPMHKHIYMYMYENNVLYFEVQGNYNQTITVVIPPILTRPTLLQGPPGGL